MSHSFVLTRTPAIVCVCVSLSPLTDSVLSPTTATARQLRRPLTSYIVLTRRAVCCVVLMHTCTSRAQVAKPWFGKGKVTIVSNENDLVSKIKQGE